MKLSEVIVVHAHTDTIDNILLKHHRYGLENMDSKPECNNINLHCFGFLNIEIRGFSIFVSGPNLRQIQIFEFS